MSCKGNQPSCTSHPQAYSKFEKQEKREQSPIDIKDLVPKEFDSPLSFYKFDIAPKVYKLKNNGETVKLTGIWQSDDIINRPTITRGPLGKDLFVFEQLHFHWPSEHRHNGHGFDLEMHAVFFNSKYNSYSKSLGKEDGVTILGVLYDKDADTKNDYDLNKITDNLYDIKEINTSIEIPNFNFQQFLNQDMGFTYGYAFYRGSLTTSPYTEKINWIVSLNPGFIVTDQRYAFRQLKFSEAAREENARDVQPIGDRKVYQVVEKKHKNK